MKIARLTDRFKIKLEGVTITVAPLSGRQKLEMTSMIKQHENGKLYIDKASQEHFLVKYSIKEVEGLKDYDGKDYVLDFHSDSLSDDCAEEVLSFLVNTYFTVANTQIISGLFGEVINPITGKAIKGISVERVEKLSEEEKKEN
jgi:hypothetical protein